MIKGFICEKTNEKVSFRDCLNCAKTRLNRKLDCPFDEAVIFGIIKNIKHKEGISVTMISGCPRSVFINRHYDTYVYPSSSYWAYRGQIAHKINEEAEIHKDAVKEKEFEKTWEGIKITGTPDITIPKQRVLKDYKTTISIPSYTNKNGYVSAYENHRIQLNLYGWLVPYEIEEMEVVYFSMEETLICPVEIWPDEPEKKSDMTVDRYMEENLVPLHEALESGTMPPYARHWSCENYCSASEICYRELKKEISGSRQVKNNGDRKKTQNNTSQKTRTTNKTNNNDRKATKKQIAYIKNMLKREGVTHKEFFDEWEIKRWDDIPFDKVNPILDWIKE